MEFAVPQHATEEVREFLRRSAAMDVEPEFVARLRDGRVFGAGQVLSADGSTLARDVALDFGKTWDEHWLLSYQKIPEPRRIEGTLAVVATALGNGYAHWLLEELPRWLALADVGGAEGKILAHVTQPFAREAWARLGGRGEVSAPGRRSHWQADELVVPSVPGPEGRPTPGLVARVRAFAVEACAAGGGVGVGGGAGERIYVSRAGARRRRVANEAELVATLAARGFATVRPEELTWGEQIAVFRRAKIVVAPHGAGLANVMFCAPGTVVVEVFNRGYVNGLFWQIAALQGLDYRPLVAAGAEPLAQEAARGREDIAVEVAAVMRAVG